MSGSSNGRDPIARDIESRNPHTDDEVAGEQVLADDPAAPAPAVAPEPDELGPSTGD
ncbi:hypothetical protein [Lacisediminihabitans changchengi]|uniref:Uncharacterized protein n=1 Tax=Lacisediminihabitans changchengi TaxID=2787634 RepID=A0A934STR0_9MICO|nr:hypothetical protein [Lacisediminihabitans changchengi]MBK4346938.1 hypothetical protein [Lacisediminihabitans changchengi]MBK4347939.1 hypothetical protein [Lacisediminihabitans changchengi]